MKKYKQFFQALVIVVVLFAAMGSFQGAQAQSGDPVVVVRDLTYWDATYTGYVDTGRVEKWPVIFDQQEDFSVTAAPSGAGLTTTVILLDESGTEITRASGVLTSSQPAGNYFVQIEPETGSGFYDLTIRRVDIGTTDPSSTTSAESTSFKVGESTLISVSLDNVPAEGYTSAEFTCTYDAAMVEVSNIAVTDLFGADSASAINGPANGSFIVAIAGSNGNKATSDGVAFTFSATGLQAGQTTIACVARVSQGDNMLTELASTSVDLTITDEVVVLDATFAGQVLAGKSVTVSLYDASDVLVATTSANEDGTFSMTAPAGTYKAVASAEGYLSAQGTATLVAGETTTQSAVSLPAGDIDGNAVIDQFDAMTIGMSYNTAEPAAADLNNDGVINVLDLELVAANYRLTGPVDWP